MQAISQQQWVLEYCCHNHKFISPFFLHFRLTALLVILFLTWLFSRFYLMIGTSVHNNIKNFMLILITAMEFLKCLPLQPFRLNSVLIVYFLRQMRTLQPALRFEFDIKNNPSFTCQLLTKLSNVHTDGEEQTSLCLPMCKN